MSPDAPAAPRSRGGASSRVARALGIGAVFAGAGLLLLAGALGLGRSREAAMPARELRPDLFSGRSAGGVFIYGVRAGTSVLVFDAAADPRGRPFELLLSAMHADRTQVAGIWATSARPDHLAGATAFPEVPLYVGTEDLAAARGRGHLASLFDRVLGLVWSLPPLPAARAILVGPAPIPGAGTGHVFEVFATPGPTRGSVSYLFDDVLFVGDLLSCHEGRLSWPPRALDAEPSQTRRSVAALGRALASQPVGMVCTGHGGCTSEGQGSHALRQLLAQP